jgi:hypothetical protein
MLAELGVECREGASLRRSPEVLDVVVEGKTDNGLRRTGMDRGKPCLGLAMLKLVGLG